jgi:TolB protein
VATVAFASGEDGDVDLYFMSNYGRDLRRHHQAFGSDLSPTFSPDGAQIAYASEQHGKLHIYKMPLSSGQPQRLTFVGYENDMPDWSPDGTNDRLLGTRLWRL